MKCKHFISMCLSLGVMFFGISVAGAVVETSKQNPKKANIAHQQQMKVMMWMQQHQQLNSSLQEKLIEKTNIQLALETAARNKMKSHQFGLSGLKKSTEEQEKMLNKRLTKLNSEIHQIEKQLKTKF